jgi:hypothetical protein
MTLPVKVVDINTATLPDFKSAVCIGPQRRVVGEPQAADDGTFYALGDTKEYVGGVLYDWGGSSFPQALIAFSLQRVGSPTFSITCFVYEDSSGSPDFSQEVSRSYPVAASSITTSKTGTNPNFSGFLLITPFTPIAGQKYWFILKTSAAGDSSNYVKLFAFDDLPAVFYTGSQAFGGSWANDTTIQRMIETYYYSDEHYIFLADKTNNKVRAYKNTVGAIGTWAEQEAVSAPAFNTTHKSFFVHNRPIDFLRPLAETRIIVARASLGCELFKFDTVSNWSGHPTITANTSASLSTGVSGIAGIGGGVRPNDIEMVFVYQGPTETVMGAARRRVKLRYFASGSWSAEFDVVGSTNTPDATLPGVATHYDLRWAGVDPNGDCHIIYSHDTNNTLQYRKFTSANAFATINTLNGAVALATGAYPVGIPTFYFQSPDWYIAVPYLDSTSSTVKVARVKTTDSATSANWTVTEAVAASAEITGSVPAILVNDAAQGGKLHLWRVKPTTKTLGYTHDSGNNTWAAETDWRSGQVVGGISGFASGFGVDLAYLEEGTSPDEIRYDHL